MLRAYNEMKEEMKTSKNILKMKIQVSEKLTKID